MSERRHNQQGRVWPRSAFHPDCGSPDKAPHRTKLLGHIILPRIIPSSLPRRIGEENWHG